MIANAVLYASLWFLAVLIWDVATDYRKWLKRKPVKHSAEGWLRAALLAPTVVLLTWNHLKTETWALVAVVGIVLVGFAWWLLFDGAYNLLRGYGVFFAGSDDKDDPKTDDLLQRWPVWLRAVVKVGGVAGSAVAYWLLTR